ADLAVRRRERMKQSRRIRGAGCAGDPEEDAHYRRPGYAAKAERERVTATASALVALRRLEERRELAEALGAEVLEGRHRRPGIHARRTFEMADLEVDPLVLRAFRRQVRRAGEPAADPLVDVAVGTADDREQVRPRNGLRVVLEALLLRPA